MSYLKGGSVVDGNLYVEGDLKVRGSSVGEEGLEYVFIVDPDNKINYIPVILANGQIDKSYFEQGEEEITERQNPQQYAKLILHEKSFLHLDVDASKMIMNYNIINETGKALTGLMGYTENDDLIREDSDYQPISEPKFWGYDNSRSIMTSYAFTDNTHMYTMPDANQEDIDVGETVIISGQAPENQNQG